VCKSDCERAERMRMRRLRAFVKKRRRTLPGRGEKGFVLIELLISIAIFGVISVGFLSALVAGYHGVRVAHDVTTAQSLTRTALENVSSVPFADVDTATDNVTVSGRFRVEIHADYITGGSDTGDYVPQSDPSSMKLVTVTVKYDESGKTILITQNTKVQ
jgi:prepilin-type N-terminal cleavage/methylation domain-containing protein